MEANQEFLSLSEYRPDASTSTSSSSASAKNGNIGAINNDIEQDISLSVSHANPQAAFFTVFFKALSIGTYVFGSFFSSNFILLFVFVILCLACDFWTVKNVTGRLLVGLRWWNHVKDDGSSEWKFESKSNNNLMKNTKNQNKDSRLFWTSLYLTPCIWILLSIACIVKVNIKWLPLNMVAIALNCAQLWGYWKCRRDANSQTKDANDSSWIPSMFAQQTIQNAIGSQIANSLQSKV